MHICTVVSCLWYTYVYTFSNVIAQNLETEVTSDGGGLSRSAIQPPPSHALVPHGNQYIVELTQG